MEVDWEVEIGGDAPVIEADWPGFIDLRADPERIGEIAEAIALPPLARLLAAINASRSAFWTSKCDVWEPEPCALACYIDVLPRDGAVFLDWHEAESFCRKLVARMRSATESATESFLLSHGGASSSKSEPGISVNLVVRAAMASEREGFGITAYLSAKVNGAADPRAGLKRAIDAFADEFLGGQESPKPGSTLK